VVDASTEGVESAEASSNAAAAPCSVPDLSASSSAQPTSMGGRHEWQDSFNLTAKRLMVDFDLTSVPDCRLNHLDRFHEWFGVNGQKQTRMARAAPNYVTISKNEVIPSGSSRSAMARQPLSGTSLILAGSMRMRKSPRLEAPAKFPPVHPAARSAIISNKV